MIVEINYSRLEGLLKELEKAIEKAEKAASICFKGIAEYDGIIELKTYKVFSITNYQAEIRKIEKVIKGINYSKINT